MALGRRVVLSGLLLLGVGLRVHRLSDLESGLFDLSLGCSHLLEVFRGEGFLGFCNGGFDFGYDVRADLVLVLREGLLGFVDRGVQVVLDLDGFSLLLVLVLHLLGGLDHSVDFVLRQASGGLDDHRLVLVCGLILGGDLHDSVGVDVEGHFDLGEPSGSRGDSDQLELAEELVVVGHLSLALEDSDRDLGLAVGGSGENLGLLRGNGGVPVNDAGEDSSESLESEGQGSDVNEDDVLDVALEDSSLDGGSDGDGLVGVDAFVGLLAEELLDQLLDLGHATHSSDQQNLVDLVLLEAGVLEAQLAGLDGLVQEVVGEALELGAGEHVCEVLGPGGVGSQVGQVDLGLQRRRQLDFGLSRRLP